MFTRNGIVIAALLGIASVSGWAADAKLADAVQNEDSAAVRTLLAQRVDVNIPQVDGSTALLWAARNEDLATAKLLLAAGAKISIANRYGVTPIVEAVSNANAAMTDLLLKAGADANTAMPEGDTVLMIAAKAGKTDVLKALLDKGAKPNVKEPWHGETAIMLAAAHNHAEAVKLLAERGADPNIMATHLEYPEMKKGDAQVFSVYPAGGLSALMHAARENSMEAAKALLAAKADATAKQPQGMTAPMIAIINGHWDMAKLLIEGGSNPSDGSLPLVADVKNLVFVRPAKDRPDQYGPMDVINTLLAKGAKVDSVLPGPVPVLHNFGTNVGGPQDSTALFRAAKKADIEVMKLLLANGANAKLILKDDTTALHASVGVGLRPTMAATDDTSIKQEDIIEALKLILDRGVDVNKADGQGNTTLHVAASKGYNDVIKFLHEHGANLELKDKKERRALEVSLAYAGKGGPTPFARADKHPETATLLKKLMGLPDDYVPPFPQDDKADKKDEKKETTKDEKASPAKPVETAQVN